MRCGEISSNEELIGLVARATIRAAASTESDLNNMDTGGIDDVNGTKRGGMAADIFILVSNVVHETLIGECGRPPKSVPSL